MSKVNNKWQILSFVQAVEPVSDGGKRVDQSEYLTDGLLPVIDQGDKFIGGYTNDKTKQYDGPLPVIAFGDHTRRVKLIDFPFVIGAQGIKLLRPRECLDAKYLLYLLRTLPIPDRGYGRHYQYVRKLKYPCPSIKEQKLIVDEIETQFTRLDAGVAALKRAQANLKRYRAAVLKAACEGKLVPTEAELARKDGRSYETGEQLLQRILSERKKKWEAEQKKTGGKKKYVEPKGPDVSSLPKLPKGWVWAGFEQLSEGTKYALKAGPFGSALKKSIYTTSGYKIYGQEQVINDDAYYGDYYISAKTYDQLKSCAVKPGDILISLVGTSGKVLILPNDIKPGIINPRLIKISLNKNGANPKFIKILLETSRTKAFFKLAAHGGTMDIINLGIIKKLPIALPPLVEQCRIVEEMERRVSVMEKQEVNIAEKIKMAGKLRSAILTNSFKMRG